MPYKIISKIASGTFGTVYKVQESTNGEFFALKLIHENYKTPNELKRIKRGFETAQKVLHPNCVKMIEWYEKGNDIGFVMEFVETIDVLTQSEAINGNSKSESLTKSQNLTDKISKIIQIANGLEALHSRGIVHRDLKPANILETVSGQIKITDFDLVKLDDSSTLTASGAFLGTAKYSSPEQCQNSSQIDLRSDLYSLGILFYQMVCERLPFDGDSVTSIILGHLRSPLTPPSYFNSKIPFEIEEIIKKLLAKDPKDRFQSAKEVAEKLTKFLQNPETSKKETINNFLLFPEFIGREKELQKLQETYSDAEKENFQLTLIGGNSGSGKSKLWKEFATGINLKSSFYLQTKAQKDSRSFESLKDILNFCLVKLEAFSDSEKIELVGRFGRDFQTISPQIAKMRFFKKLPQVTRLERKDFLQRLFLAFCEFLEKLSENKTLILFFDDVQWIDSETSEWIKFAQNYFSRNKVFIAGTFRENEFENSNFAKSVDNFETIKLEDLKLEQIKSMVSSMLGKIDPIETEIAEFFLKRTNGNPLFIEELMFNFLQNGTLTKKANEWHFNKEKLLSEKLPKSIHSVVLERISSLNQDSKQILQIASLFKRPFSTDLIRRFFPNFSIESLSEVFKNATLENYIAEKDGFFRFYHDSVKETLEISILKKDKKVYNKAIAEKLEENFSQDLIPDLAHHFYQAEIPSKAKKYNLLAYQNAEKSYSLFNAINYLEIGIQLEQDKEKIVELLIEKSQLLRKVGLPDKAEKTAFETHKIAKETSNEKLIAFSLLSLGNEKLQNVELKESLKHIETALRTFKKLKIEDKIVDSYFRMGQYFTIKGQFQESIKYCLKALKLAENKNFKELEAEILYNNAVNHQGLGELDTALVYLEKSIKLANEMGNFTEVIFYEISKATILRGKNRLQEALNLFEKNLKEAENIGFNEGIYTANIGISNIYFLRKKLSKSISFLERSIEVVKKIGDKLNLTDAIANYSYFNFLVGDFENSWNANEEFLKNIQFNNSQDKAIYHKNKAHNQFARKDYKNAAESFEKSISFRNNDNSVPGVLVLKANALFEFGDLEKAKEANEKTLSLAENSGDEITIFRAKLLSLKIKFSTGLQKESLENFLDLIENEKNEDRLAEELFEFCSIYSKKENLTLLPNQKINFEDFRQRAIDLHKKLIENDESYILKERLEDLANLKNESGIFQSNLFNSLIPLMEPQTVLNEAIAYLTEETNSDNCFIILKNKVSGKFEPCSFSPNLKDEELDFSKSILNETIQKQKPTLVENALESEEFSGNESIIGKIFLSVISVPLKADDKIIGAIYLDRTNPRKGIFENHDLQKVEEISRALLPVIQKQNESLHLKIESQIRELGIFVGNSPKMKEIYEDIENAASYNFPVYIFGETGTGKELVANALHKLSPRRNNSFVALNCSAIPKDLAESELFGHKKGAFTGATFDKKGIFEQAENGTILLDEVGELSLANQAKLLRVIQEKKFKPIGSEKSIKVNVRILVATHKNLEEEVEKGNFREDLRHRLDVLKISLPPLRERKEDIPLLAYHILEKFNSDSNKKIQGFSDEVLNSFSKRIWKGNVRELENTVIKAAVKKKENGLLELEDFSLSQKIESKNSNSPENKLQTLLSFVKGNTLSEKVSFFEKVIFEQTLKECNFNKTKAAQKLGISRTHVHRILKKINSES